MREYPELLEGAEYCLKTLCSEFGNRSVGSPGNLRATAWFRDRVEELGWEVESHRLSVVDWEARRLPLNPGERASQPFPPPTPWAVTPKGP